MNLSPIQTKQAVESHVLKQQLPRQLYAKIRHEDDDFERKKCLRCCMFQAR